MRKYENWVRICKCNEILFSPRESGIVGGLRTWRPRLLFGQQFMRNKSLLHLSFHSVIYTLAFVLARLLLAKIKGSRVSWRTNWVSEWVSDSCCTRGLLFKLWKLFKPQMESSSSVMALQTEWMGWNPCLEECEASQSDRKDNPQMAITKRRGHLYKKCEQISVYFDCGPVKWPETLVTRS